MEEFENLIFRFCLNRLVELSEEVYLWIEQDTSIHLKAVTKYGDPVELSAEEARELAKVLEELARKLDE